MRLRKHFRGGASPLIVILLLALLGASAFALRQASLLGNGLYRLGISGDVPAITDPRFSVRQLDPAQGQNLLNQGAIDVYIAGDEVFSRPDEKSQNAVGALRKYFEKEEIERISNEVEPQLAFPLRIGVGYLNISLPTATAVIAATSSNAAASQATPTPTQQEIIIPSLMTPKAPFGEVVLCLVYILPVTFISIFFTSSFMDEKINRRLTILLSTPLTPFQIILGKMLPYTVFSMAATALIAYLTHANILTALSIFTPTILFIFAIYLMVPLFYRTFKDTTFISMLVTTLTTVYLIFPAMFNGVSDFAYMSPLTLAVKMYKGEFYGWREYLFPSLPMVLIFFLAMYAGTKLLNEEFLMGYRSLAEKAKDAIFLVMDRFHPYRSVGLLSLLMIPLVYLAQLVILAIATNLPPSFMLAAMLFAAAFLEEIVKSIGIVVWLEHGVVKKVYQVLILSLLSALGFLAGEKLLLLFSMSVVSQSLLSGALFSSGLLLIPLLAHFVFTSLITLLRCKTRLPYTLILFLVTILHSLYNWILMRGI